MQLKLDNRVSTFFGKDLPDLLAICSFCGCFIVFVCLSFLCVGLDVKLIVPVAELFLYLHLLSTRTGRE